MLPCPKREAAKKGCFKPVAQVLILREGIFSHIFAFDAPKKIFQKASVFDASFDCPPAMLYAERAGAANDMCQTEPCPLKEGRACGKIVTPHRKELRGTD